MAVWGIVVAGGTGTRFGAAKQFVSIGDQRMVDVAVHAVARSCDAGVVVLPAGVEWDGPPVAAAVTGGETRSDSVRAGLAALPADVEIIVVHDAARPLAAPALFDAVIDAVRAGADAALPAVALRDTVKRVSGTRVLETLDRESLAAAQTPQAFAAAALRGVHAGGGHATDDAALVERAGGTVETVPGDPRNLKVTTAEDLLVAVALAEVRDGHGR